MDASCDFISTKLVEKVQSLSKKPSLDTDIRGILQECLKNVDNQSVYLENGIFNFNLAEVAIVLEHVTLIYGKKVDLLWDCLLNYQKRLLKFNTQESKTVAEEKLIEERMEKYKHRRKKKHIEETLGGKDFDIKSLLPQLSIEYDTDETLSLRPMVWKDFADLRKDSEREPVDRYLRPFFVGTSHPIYLNNEYLCDNAQILSNNYYFETYDYIRQTKYNFLGDTEIEATGQDLEDDITQKFLVENNLKFINMTEEQIKELNVYIDQQLLEKMPFKQKCKRLCPRRSSIMLTQLSQDVVEKYLKGDRMSIEETSVNNQSSVLNDSGISEFDLNSVDGNTETQQLTNVNNIQVSIENTNENREEQVLISNNIGKNSENIEENAQDNVDNIDTNVQNSESGTISDSNSSKNVREEEDDGFIDNHMEFDEVENDNEENLISNMTVETTIKKNKEGKQRKSKLAIIDDQEELPVPKKRLCRKHDILKLRKVITRPLEEFELFFYENYKPQGNEGQIVIDEYIRNIFLKQSQELKVKNVITKLVKDYETFYYKNYKPDDAEGTLIEPISPEMSAVEQDNLDSEDHVFLSQDSGICDDIETGLDDSTVTNEAASIENEITANLDTTIGVNVIGPVTTSTPVLNEPSMANGIDTSMMDVFLQEHEANKKYFAWKRDVERKLARTDTKDFDIHEYGSQVLGMLPDNEPVKFNTVMKTKKSSEVARLFIASLQLVNTSNIKMLDNTPGQLANGTLQFQLLSRDRHHEHLETYMAPSLENRAVTLNKLQNIHRNRASTSRNSNTWDELPRKKKKLI